MKRYIPISIQILLLFVFILNGCGEVYYEVEPNAPQMKYFKSNPTTKHKQGIMKRYVGSGDYYKTYFKLPLYYNDKDAYTIFSYYASKYGGNDYCLYGITVQVADCKDSLTQLIDQYRLRPMQQLKNGNYFAEPIHLYVKVYQEGEYLVFEYSDDMNNRTIKKEINQDRTEKTLQKMIERYDLPVQDGYIDFYPDDKDAIGVNGKGRVSFIAQGEIADKIDLIGTFKEGRIIGDVTVKIKGSRCVEAMLICTESVYETVTLQANASNLSRKIREGIRQLKTKLSDAYRQYKNTHSKRSVSSQGTYDCDIYKNRCLNYCDSKSNVASGLGNSDKLSCQLGCQSAARACQRGNRATWEVGTCRAICQGVNNRDADILIPFSSSSFDQCVNRCQAEFFR